MGGVSVQSVWVISIMQCTGCINDGMSEDIPVGSVWTKLRRTLDHLFFSADSFSSD